ncbi:hypothetical protein [Pediococcus ethanolidurans]|uniref:Uncharacterized protein n=1 Tax=Pediococcus ethanolidurans TaxID=319653 RepID=A0A0R2K132_9LACO|nr:hypothetical protein [Pediococcus ethanolidurans]KRN83330.1 hypothetical protein IV87_GL001365 [Pediococcus ethanolidurans]GEN94531.1 hypothetical protein PET01_05810 [Pediococcus ethanolidurans]SER28623.1 hypothetical protein SAMN04487973_10411 [Pediococcus ethanolidurans]
MAQKTKEEKTSQIQSAYTDHYFEKGHWWLKVWQTLVALFGWICVVVPLIVTILSYLGVKYHFFKPLWTYREGIFEIQFIGVILLFAFVMVLVFSVSMALIQNRKRDRLVEQWPTFNPINQKKRTTELDQFMDRRFGPEKARQNTRNYRVEPEQNLKTHEIKQLFDQHHIDDL